MAGIVPAWKQFNVTLGLFGSPWAGWKYFERLLDAPDFFRALRNTLFINGIAASWDGYVQDMMDAGLAQLLESLANKGM
ncbi:MAG: hypothetical protein OXQ31_27520 [Spirochaetaceae bacterium]|nr:hypothetical protein [Spirochaetaceae bacterium]